MAFSYAARPSSKRSVWPFAKRMHHFFQALPDAGLVGSLWLRGIAANQRLAAACQVGSGSGGGLGDARHVPEGRPPNPPPSGRNGAKWARVWPHRNPLHGPGRRAGWAAGARSSAPRGPFAWGVVGALHLPLGLNWRCVGRQRRGAAGGHPLRPGAATSLPRYRWARFGPGFLGGRSCSAWRPQRSASRLACVLVSSNLWIRVAAAGAHWCSTQRPWQRKRGLPRCARGPARGLPSLLALLAIAGGLGHGPHTLSHGCPALDAWCGGRPSGSRACRSGPDGRAASGNLVLIPGRRAEPQSPTDCGSRRPLATKDMAQTAKDPHPTSRSCRAGSGGRRHNYCPLALRRAVSVVLVRMFMLVGLAIRCGGAIPLGLLGWVSGQARARRSQLPSPAPDNARAAPAHVDYRAGRIRH